jgi:hypothetical protein
VAQNLKRRRGTRSITIPEIAPAGGTGSLDAARPSVLGNLKRFIRVLGPGLITGASDDDPSGIGTYAIAGWNTQLQVMGETKLKERQPSDFLFTILQRTSPDMERNEISLLESSWKDRLHTRENGLNDNRSYLPTNLAMEDRDMANRDESYVIDLCDRVLNLKAKRQHRFDFLRGDSGRKLPVDAYYEISVDRKLVVEYREMQHSEPVAFFDKRLTCSGCNRASSEDVTMSYAGQFFRITTFG